MDLTTGLLTAGEIAVGGYGRYGGVPGAAKTVAGGVSGLGRETAEQAYRAAPEFRGAQSGRITGGEIVRESRDAVHDVYTQMQQDFSNSMAQVTAQNKNLNLNLSRVMNKFDDILTQRGIQRRTTATGDEFLDFNRTRFSHDEGAKTDLRKVDEILKTALDDPTYYSTPEGMHTLKQQLYAHMKTFERDTKTRSIADGVWKEIRQELGDKVPGYNEMNKKFQTTTDLLEEMEKAVTGNDKTSINTTLQKLHTMMKEDMDFRRMIVSDIEARSGKDIKALVAGYMTRGYMPQTYIGKQVGYGSAFGIGSLGAYTQNPGVLLIGLSGTALASPKIMSKIMRTLANTQKSYDIIRKTALSYPYRQATYQGGRITGATVTEVGEE